ncbi:ABC-F type ribosomal protection protein [Alkalicella caledoniensis]|uniref:ABC-F type ribosomal protection protein n=1 Tax=Alkalicella caledoniensis TaxID=2731377 RepID=A0A7G9W7B6_ALKCA|nr:ABC-F type ribosomal protection protein [Alkalicella caledoniensis]QNO14578.1 ABC-F type ribosomal protection protein [Alkalicella caledoniensis]
MFVFKGKELKKEIEGKILFENVNIEINEGEHIALIGRNGIGKTTLLKGILGYTTFDGGYIQRRIPTNDWGYVVQNPYTQEKTVLSYVQSANENLHQLKKDLVKYQEDPTNPIYQQGYQAFIELNGFTWELEVERVLSSVGLPKESWSLPFHTLSGGQKTRAQIARIMISNPKFLVLDEPTNHLDNQTLQWLENWLRDYPGAFLVVSHDRYFLDMVAHWTYELTEQGTNKYKGGYSQFKEQKALEFKTQWDLYKKQERQKKELKETIQRYTQWFGMALNNAKKVEDPHARFAMRTRAQKHVNRFKAKEKEMERLEKDRVEKPRNKRQLKMEIVSEGFEARTLARLESVSFGYSEKIIFEKISISIKKGERIGIIGPNGVGKSTLLKLLTGHLNPQKGEIVLNPQVRIGYFAQELEGLDLQETLLDSLLKIPQMTLTQARTILGCFLFSKDEVYKKIGDLSMGEKCRVAFLRLYFSGANLLVLDEPTNYLDIDTREIIEESLLEFSGAVICVSHDRYLLEKIATSIVDLKGGVTNFPGNYKEYIESKSQNTFHDLERENTIRNLELKLATLMATEGVKSENDLVAEIRKLKEEIEELTIK